MSGVEPDLKRWDAWRPAEVAGLLAGVEVPWWVAGGWALAHWRGRQSRPHADLEICVPRAEWAPVRERLAGCDLWCVRDGRVRPLPADEPVPDAYRQVWVQDRGMGAWRLDVMLEAAGRAEWVCHRDARIRRPLAEALAVTPGGIPYLRPEIALLLKAKYRRAKDEADLDLFLPLLDPPARRWLADALATLHPGHPWLERVRPLG
jgi:hypothetical protein